MTAGLNYTRLGSLRGLPIFPVGGLLAVPLLGGRQVDGRVEVVGDFRRLGLVNYTIRVTYMGVSNVTEFVGFAVPPDAYTAANRTYGLLPPEARPYYRYLLERAVATGDWRLVEDLAKLYSEPPTPLTLAARALVEMSLASGREPNMYPHYLNPEVAEEIYSGVNPFTTSGAVVIVDRAKRVEDRINQVAKIAQSEEPAVIIAPHERIQPRILREALRPYRGADQRRAQHPIRG